MYVIALSINVTFKELASSIQEHGQLQPIIVNTAMKVVDGQKQARSHQVD